MAPPGAIVNPAGHSADRMRVRVSSAVSGAAIAGAAINPTTNATAATAIPARRITSSTEQLRHLGLELLHRPPVVLLDGLGHRPRLEEADGAALDEEDLAGGRARLRREIGDERRDVGRIPDVELA